VLQRLRSMLSLRYQWFCLMLLDRFERLALPDRIFLPLCGWYWLIMGTTNESVADFTRFGKRFSLRMGFATWCRFRILRGVSGGTMLRYRRWIRDATRPNIKIEGAELVHEAKAKGRGVLVLTYHHHFNTTFCAAIGRFFGRVSVFAGNPAASPAYPTMKYFANIMYAGSEQFFGGGKYMYVDAGKPFGSRAAIEAFKSRSLVVSVHDFPAFRPPSMSGLFLNPDVAYPTGAIDYALRKDIPILFGFLDWQGGDHFRLCFRPCTAAADTRAVLASYFSVLEQDFFAKPERWEFWGTVQ
jgi:lauroyl/myristoyl acyltransferase